MADRLADVAHQVVQTPRGAQVKKAHPDFKDRQLDKALEYLHGQIKLADKVKSVSSAKKNGKE